MKRIIGFALLAVFVFAGCSQAPTEESVVNPFDEEFGGVTTENEDPGFGDEDLLAIDDDVAVVDDDVAAALEAECDRDGSEHVVFALRAIWGQLRYDSTSITPLVWDGGITVDSGRIGALRTIRFERGQDELVRPRTAPNILKWISTTTVHNDGILVLIGIPKAVLADTIPDQVSFRTGPLSVSFTVREAATLDTVISVDDAGNAVMLNGFLIRPDICPKGYLEGKWMTFADQRGGEFEGRWMSRHGDLEGYLKGKFGYNGDGRPVFFGKYVDVDGRFEGHLRGVWGPGHGKSRGGFFKGVFYDPMDRPIGRLHGHWRAEEAGAGLFAGVWKAACPEWSLARHRWQNWDDVSIDDGLLEGAGSEMEP